MRKTINKTHIEGKVYSHSLEIKTVQNESSKNYGKEYIGGKLEVATDEDNMNIVTVEFPYVTETTSAGKKNATYTALKNIIESNKTVLTGEPMLVKIDSELGVNDFYTNRNGEDVLVSAKRNSNGFVTIINKLADEGVRSTFEMDVLIIGTKLVEADEENNIPEDYMVLNGYVFGYKNAIIPIDFHIRNKEGIRYFENADPSKASPMFTKVWGQQISKSISEQRTEESAFGEPIVKEYKKNFKEWLVTGTSKSDAVYEIGDEKNGITAEEVNKAISDREFHLAEVKKQADEYRASREATTASSEVPFAGSKVVTAAAGGFNF